MEGKYLWALIGIVAIVGLVALYVTVKHTGTPQKNIAGQAWGQKVPDLNLWESNGNDIYYDEGNVGIGTDTPQQTLEIKRKFQ